MSVSGLTQDDLKQFLTKKQLEESNVADSLDHIICSFPISVENVTDLTQEEFVKTRFKDFGASDSAVLLQVAYHKEGRNPVAMKTIVELLEEKVNEYVDESIGLKASVRKGRDLEPLIIDKISNTLGIHIVKPKHTYANRAGLSVNFDGIAFEMISPSFKETPNNSMLIGYMPIPFEIKVCTVWARKNYDWDKGAILSEDLKSISKKTLPVASNYITMQEKIYYRAKELGIPPYYYTQLQDHMYFTNADHGYLAVLDDVNWEIYLFYIPRDSEMIAELLRISNKEYIELAIRKNIDITHLLPDTDMNSI